MFSFHFGSFLILLLFQLLLGK